jgi:hypothetical protein
LKTGYTFRILGESGIRLDRRQDKFIQHVFSLGCLDKRLQFGGHDHDQILRRIDVDLLPSPTESSVMIGIIGLGINRPKIPIAGPLGFLHILDCGISDPALWEDLLILPSSILEI